MSRSSPSWSRTRWRATGSPGCAEVHEDLVAVDADGEAPQLVRELVERPARLEVEARVVPVAREDSVAHGSAMQRETHVRTAVVDRVHVVPVGEEADDVSVVVDDKPPGLAQFRERRDGDKRGQQPRR